MRFTGRCFRGHDPRWSFSPLSGDGAAKTGGRFNRKGEAALYMSLDVMTAIGECTQGFANRLSPLTMVEYDVDCEPVADLRTEAARAVHGVSLDEMACGWLVHLRAGTEAPSWLVADRLRGEGFVGMLAPSFAHSAGAGNDNLILWQWGRLCAWLRPTGSRSTLQRSQEDRQGVPRSATDRLLDRWTEDLPGYHLYYPNRRFASPAFKLLVDTLRFRAG